VKESIFQSTHIPSYILHCYLPTFKHRAKLKSLEVSIAEDHWEYLQQTLHIFIASNHIDEKSLSVLEQSQLLPVLNNLLRYQVRVPLNEKLFIT
jgi:hypothetical protein